MVMAMEKESTDDKSVECNPVKLFASGELYI